MTREQLLALGFTDEQVNQIMALHGQATQGLNATISANNAELSRLKGVETQYTALLSQQPKEPENPELANALKRIAELEAENIRKDIKAYAASKGFSGEQADKMLGSLQNDYDLAVCAIDSISQIISDKEIAAATAKEQELAAGATNPGAGDADTETTKSVGAQMAQKFNQTNVVV